jgi:hypothetical protein
LFTPPPVPSGDDKHSGGLNVQEFEGGVPQAAPRRVRIFRTSAQGGTGSKGQATPAGIRGGQVVEQGGLPSGRDAARACEGAGCEDCRFAARYPDACSYECRSRSCSSDGSDSSGSSACQGASLCDGPIEARRALTYQALARGARALRAEAPAACDSGRSRISCGTVCGLLGFPDLEA